MPLQMPYLIFTHNCCIDLDWYLLLVSPQVSGYCVWSGQFNFNSVTSSKKLSKIVYSRPRELNSRVNLFISYSLLYFFLACNYFTNLAISFDPVDFPNCLLNKIKTSSKVSFPTIKLQKWNLIKMIFIRFNKSSIDDHWSIWIFFFLR